MKMEVACTSETLITLPAFTQTKDPIETSTVDHHENKKSVIHFDDPPPPPRLLTGLFSLINNIIFSSDASVWELDVDW
jgi:hypothetical protein